MPKYIVALRVQVPVEANSPSDAERLAFRDGEKLCATKGARVTTATVVREESK